MDSVDKVNKLSKSDFISIFGNVFEKTAWIAEKVFAFKPFENFDELTERFLNIFENEKKENHLKVLNFHPELAVEKIMTIDSKKEQNNAELNQCTKEELEEFVKLNKDYKKKFNFPFIIAVSGKNKSEILDNFRKRIKNDKNTEFKEAIRQVKKIASSRLKQINNN
jgi:OHCU decarboxylase